MEFKEALNRFCLKYQKYGFTREFLKTQLEDGVFNQKFSVNVAYNGLRMCLAESTGEHELFTLEDVMEITGESREELLQRMDGLIAAGELEPVEEPPEKMTFYFPHGISLQ